MDAKTIQSTASLFRTRVSSSVRTVTLEFEGRRLSVREGSSLAAALLIEAAGPFRSTTVSAAPRAPYCMMGVCFECLLEVDGVPNRQACLLKVRDGMVVRRQNGAAALQMPAQGEGHEH